MNWYDVLFDYYTSRGYQNWARLEDKNIEGEPKLFTRYEFFRNIFHNYRTRAGEEKGLLLKPTGRNWMLRNFDEKKWSMFKIPSRKSLTNRVIVGLDKTMKTPYYIIGTKLFVYECPLDQYTLLHLSDGDLETFIESFSEK